MRVWSMIYSIILLYKSLNQKRKSSIGQAFFISFPIFQSWDKKMMYSVAQLLNTELTDWFDRNLNYKNVEREKKNEVNKPNTIISVNSNGFITPLTSMNELTSRRHCLSNSLINTNIFSLFRINQRKINTFYIQKWHTHNRTPPFFYFIPAINACWICYLLWLLLVCIYTLFSSYIFFDLMKFNSQWFYWLIKRMLKLVL